MRWSARPLERVGRDGVEAFCGARRRGLAELVEWSREVSWRPARRVLTERVEVACAASGEGGGGARREVLRALSEGSWASVPRGLFSPPKTVVKGATEGVG